MGISQERLGEMVGVTYQQIQKYEKGINKVNSEMLQKIAHSLEVPIDFFFKEDDDTYDALDESGGMKDIRETRSVYQPFTGFSQEEKELIECFRAIADEEYRKCFLFLLRKASGKAHGE